MNVTQNAIRALKTMLETSANRGSAIRITVLPGCCSPKLQIDVADLPRETEKTISVEGIALFIDKQTEPLISGYTLDYNTNGFKLDLLFPQGRCCK